MQKLLKKVFPDPSVKLLAKLREDVEQINVLEPAIEPLTDEQLRAKTDEFKERLNNGETLDDLMFEAFAVVREAAKRTLGQRHYDVQLIGGMAMHFGNIAEMRTGEGKTLTATAPLYLNALAGKGAHLVTVNDYLSRRDAAWMGRVFHFLGMTTGCVQSNRVSYLYDPDYNPDTQDAGEDSAPVVVDMDELRPVERKDAYAADITYGTNNEFGFDFLRDNMVPTLKHMSQRELFFSIVDEVDSILIDEARTPLIISAPADTPSEMYYRFSQIAKTLVENEDYNIDEKLKTATLTEAGIEKVENALGVENLYTAQGVEMVHHMEEALRAHALYKNDRDYVVKDGEIVIVDEFTGRLMQGRRYSEGLHQAIEAKEGVEIRRESQTLATVTFQNYFRMYEKLAGMTGTAETDKEEFEKTYGMDVVVVPTNRPIQREDFPDRVYKNELGKFRAVVQEVKRLHEKGQPVLVGSVSIDKNEILDQLLTAEGIPHETLNAKNHAREAEIIAQAGKPGAVTLATNMAGRGVDIILGGTPKSEEAQEEVKKLGGLYVLGTERHESRRIDNQLRGRSGRQGDVGATQFYVSMEDGLMRVFGSDRMKNIMNTLGVPDDQPIENAMVTRAIAKAQERVEGYHYDSRKHLLSYDNVLNKHRESVYKERRDVLERFEEDDVKSLREVLLSHFDQAIEEVVMFHTSDSPEDVPEQFRQEGLPESGDKDTKEILETLQAMMPLSSDQKAEIQELLAEVGAGKDGLAEQRTKIIETLLGYVEKTLDALEAEFVDTEGEEDGSKHLKDIERAMMLRAIDRLWIDHLDAMTALRQGIGLRGYGQRDPLVEYKRESFGLFNRLLTNISMEVASNFFKFAHRILEAKQAEDLARTLYEKRGIQLTGAAKTMEGGSRAASRAAAKMNAQAAAGGGPGEAMEKVGRNESCPCGSGKKYKKCHGA